MGFQQLLLSSIDNSTPDLFQQSITLSAVDGCRLFLRDLIWKIVPLHYTSVECKVPNFLPPILLKVIDHFNGHYAETQTLDTLAAQFFVSKATLVYNFKKYTSCSPIDFLLNVRLTKAKELLVNTRKSVGEIAELCGFSSSNYFGLIFKQKEHLSPLQYRKNERSKY